MLTIIRAAQDAPIDPFHGLPKKAFGVILADPPWRFALRSEKGNGRSPDQHYDTMTLEQIKALPVADLAAEDCVLLMWVTDPLMHEGLEVIKSWGFSYKTVGFYWTKENRKSEGDFVGMGYWTRANPEMCLLATRGSPKRYAKNVRKLLRAKVREHSRKPDELYPRIDALLGEDTPKVELFSRQSRPGWAFWGLETDYFEES